MWIRDPDSDVSTEAHTSVKASATERTKTPPSDAPLDWVHAASWENRPDR